MDGTMQTLETMGCRTFLSRLFVPVFLQPVCQCRGATAGIPATQRSLLGRGNPRYRRATVTVPLPSAVKASLSPTDCLPPPGPPTSMEQPLPMSLPPLAPSSFPPHPDDYPRGPPFPSDLPPRSSTPDTPNSSGPGQGGDGADKYCKDGNDGSDDDKDGNND